MNILVYDLFGSFQINDLMFFLKKMGHKCKYIQYLLDDKYENKSFEEAMTHELENNDFDVVFTTNYYPIVSRICHEKDVYYISWTYDSPPEIIFSETLEYSTNRMFFFSKYDYQAIKDDYGIENSYYLPLAVNTERLDKIKSEKKYESDVALVGGLYNSDSFLGLKSIMSKEQQIYIDAVIAVQMKYTGSSVIDAALSNEFTDRVCAYYRSQSKYAIQPNKQQLFYAICSHITHMERLALLRLSAGEGYRTRLYLSQLSDQNRKLLEKHKVDLCEGVGYEEEMPAVFKSTKINLNPTLRANRTGIPLRVVDVLGCGGFLLTTHQSEIDDFFDDGEIAYYENVEDAMEKMDFYLKHEDERLKIAKVGYERVRKDFTFPDRIEKMLSVISD